MPNDDLVTKIDALIGKVDALFQTHGALIAKADALTLAVTELAMAQRATGRAAAAQTPAAVPTAPPDLKGRMVRVAKASKTVPAGTVGVVIWIGPSKSGPGFRVGVKDRAGTVHWTAADAVELLQKAAQENLAAAEQPMLV
ncbi:MAG: hypothetical protein MUF54_01485 [Polyangiaceae bacterium]|nr:hypothetical protein [Polyangiaceae bacterium]